MDYVAFLRAINVGGHTVKMARLKAIFESIELDDVATFIASGNVLFRSRARAATLEMKIERLLEDELGYPTSTFLRTMSEVREVAATAIAEEGVNLYVGFLKLPPAARAASAARQLSTAIDDLEVKGRELYWASRKSIGTSTLSGAAIERALGMPLTLRNITTIQRLAAR